MMPDSNVDVYVRGKENNSETNEDTDKEHFMFERISEIFCKCAGDNIYDTFAKNIKSRVLELHDDLYTCIDVQAYSCLPQATESSNPLQYVVALNPRLLLTNYTMAPLSIYEIDDPKVNTERKLIANLAPATSAYIVQLDLSAENKSDIEFELLDTVLEGHVLTKRFD